MSARGMFRGAGRRAARWIGLWAAWIGAAPLVGCDEANGLLVDAGDAGTSDASSADSGVDELVASTRAGLVEGTLAGTVRAFLGIPYAKPPVGPLRFMPPEPPTAWSGVREVKAYGPSCPQPESVVAAPGTKSEDCLTLNVFTPRAATRKLPVMVWIHGGGFVTGGSNQYDGARLASEGLVVVTINYRLGPLGFLSHPQLDAARSLPSGNDGLRDQQLALSWVHDNIAAFQGDPDNVTVFGESAGAISTCLHMVSPSTRGLARRFITQSGSCVGNFLISSKQQSDALGMELSSALCAGAPDAIACLRGQEPSLLASWMIQRGISGPGWNPVVNPDDPLVPEPALSLIGAGKHVVGEVIVGTNENEWGLFGTVLAVDASTKAKVEAIIDQSFPPYAASALKAQYTAGVSDATATEAYKRLMTATMLRCPTRALARALIAKGSPVYLYSFEEGLAVHGFEIPYVFRTPQPALGILDVEPLGGVMQGYWARFAESGDPNQPGTLDWPRFELESDRHMTFKNPPSVGQGLWRADCDLWESLFTLLM